MNLRKSLALTAALLLATCLAGCPKEDAATGDADAEAKPATDNDGGAAAKPGKDNENADGDKGKPAAGALKTDKGVDAAKKTVKIATLNDESGPAVAIGKPFALGKRILAKQVNAGGSGILPDGWKVELVEKDHGYNPGKSKQAYGEVKDDVLFIGTSFGTPNTLPLLKDLERDNVVAFPASLSSEMAKNAHTPPAGPSYAVEAMRAMDWVVEDAGGADKVKAGLVFQKDDYGADGEGGWKEAAKHHGVKIVAEQTVAPGQKDVTAVVQALKDAGANYVLLTTLPSATGPILGTAAQLKYQPKWIGNTPAWVDAFFSEKVMPAPLDNFYWVIGLPFWGEKVPGMDKFLEAFKAHGGDATPDFYTLVSYVQGLVQLEALKRAIEKGDVTRVGYLDALKSIKKYDAGGMIQPIDLTHLPYVAGTKTRVVKPKRAEKTWEVVADYADPKAIFTAP